MASAADVMCVRGGGWCGVVMVRVRERWLVCMCVGWVVMYMEEVVVVKITLKYFIFSK